MAWLHDGQNEVQYDMHMNRPGSYVILLNYYSTELGSNDTISNVIVDVSTQNGRKKGRAILYICRYTWTCRQVVTNMSGDVAVFSIDSNNVNIVVKVSKCQLNFSKMSNHLNKKHKDFCYIFTIFVDDLTTFLLMKNTFLTGWDRRLIH